MRRAECRESKKGQCSVQGASSIRNIFAPSPRGAAEGAVLETGGAEYGVPFARACGQPWGPSADGGSDARPPAFSSFLLRLPEGRLLLESGGQGVSPVRKGCPWQRRAQGAQWIRRTERKTADTHTEGWRARAGVERSRRAHRLLAEARWPGQKPGCQAAPAAVPGGPPAARGQLPSE